jgi:hypothetical protein
VLENKVLRRMFRPKRDEVTEEWIKLHTWELHNLYSPPDIIRQIKSRIMWWAGHVARIVEGRNVYRVLVGKPEGKRLERPRRRWEDGIEMDLKDVGWEGVEWIHLAQDRDCWRAVVNAVMNLRVMVPQSYFNRLTLISLTAIRHSSVPIINTLHTHLESESQVTPLLKNPYIKSLQQD